jgi:hypothetical protein
MFSKKNIFGISQCLVGAKIIVNENHFKFNFKTSLIFGKRFTAFSDLNSSFLHTRLWKSVTA